MLSDPDKADCFRSLMYCTLPLYSCCNVFVESNESGPVMFEVDADRGTRAVVFSGFPTQAQGGDTGFLSMTSTFPSLTPTSDGRSPCCSLNGLALGP